MQLGQSASKEHLATPDRLDIMHVLGLSMCPVIMSKMAEGAGEVRQQDGS